MNKLMQTICDCSSGDLYLQTGHDKTEGSKFACERCCGRGWYFPALGLAQWYQNKVNTVAPEPLTGELKQSLDKYNDDLKQRRLEHRAKQQELLAKKLELREKELEIQERELELSAKARIIEVRQSAGWQERIQRML